MAHVNNDYLTYATVCRSRIETNLAKELYGIFDTAPIIDELRNVVGAAFENLVPFINDKPSNETFKNRLVKNKEHQFLEVLSKFGCKPPPYGSAEAARNNLMLVWKSRAQWNASDCSDIIRLFGDLCEQAKGVLVRDQKDQVVVHGKQNAEDFDRYKPDQYFFAVDPSKTKPVQLKAREQFEKQYPVSRTRASPDYARTMPQKNAPPEHIVKGRSTIRTCKLGGPEPFWGINTVRLLPGSTVRKVDIAFGLPEGADASGTTADSILVVNRVKSFAEAYKALGADLFKSVPEYLLQLLPLVTMVSKGHHTLFESALTLTFHNYINYIIGFYDSLLPDASRLGGVDVGRIETALSKATHHKDNAHLLAYYDEVGSVYEGCVFTTDTELDNFKSFAALRGLPPVEIQGGSFPWLNKFRDRVSPMVTWKDLLRIGAPVPNAPVRDKTTVESRTFKYAEANGQRKFRQADNTRFLDESGRNYVKCAAHSPNAFQIKIGAWNYGWLRPA